MSAAPPLRMLDPRPLGEDWRCYVGSSAFGVVWRAARLNCLHRSDLRTVLGVTLRSADDVFRRMTRSEAQQAALSRTYPIGDFPGRLYWRLEDWWPFGGSIPWESIPWRVRLCPACARSCYHSLLFQMPGVKRCPWHRVELVERCPRCERPLLVGFREGLPLGLCPCGHDLVNHVATVEGEVDLVEEKHASVRSYREWASKNRQSDWLISPEQPDADAWSALHGFTRHTISELLSGQRQIRSTEHPARSFIEAISLRRCFKKGRPKLSPNSGLESFKPAMASLPIGWMPPLSAVGSQLLGMLSEATRARASREGDLKKTIGRLPAYPCGNHVFLHTECFDRAVLRSLARLSAGLSPAAARPIFAAQPFSLWVSGHPLGTRLVERTIQRMVLRGYADGARVVLGREAPELYAKPRTRPATRFPWVVLRLPEGVLPSAQIAWTLQPGTV